MLITMFMMMLNIPQDKWRTLLGDIVINVGNSKWVEEGGANSSDEISENDDDAEYFDDDFCVEMMNVMAIMALQMITICNRYHNGDDDDNYDSHSMIMMIMLMMLILIQCMTHPTKMVTMPDQSLPNPASCKIIIIVIKDHQSSLLSVIISDHHYHRSSPSSWIITRIIKIILNVSNIIITIFIDDWEDNREDNH